MIIYEKTGEEIKILAYEDKEDGHYYLYEVSGAVLPIKEAEYYREHLENAKQSVIEAKDADDLLEKRKKAYAPFNLKNIFQIKEEDADGRYIGYESIGEAEKNIWFAVIVDLITTLVDIGMINHDPKDMEKILVYRAAGVTKPEGWYSCRPFEAAEETFTNRNLLKAFINEAGKYIDVYDFILQGDAYYTAYPKAYPKTYPENYPEEP